MKVFILVRIEDNAIKGVFSSKQKARIIQRIKNRKGLKYSLESYEVK